MSGPILDVRSLSVSYGKIEAIHALSLEVRPGTIVTVIGPNGAGKSTTLNAVSGLLPSRGTIQFLGRDVSNSEVEDRVEAGLILVPERRELFTGMTVSDNLRLGAYRFRRESHTEMASRLEAVYSTFPRLEERSSQLAGTLSGGERQMLAIGRALMSRPSLLMLDEPSLGLAPLVTREIFRIIAALRRTGVAVLLIEQNARAALEIADYGYVIERGAVVMADKAASLSENPKLIETYLGLPAVH
ncbi:ABC transporter ATP-binding protein [Bradyrhizobium tropiciagri]|uniref:ABC transporter ATP-binding protein n=1 Tax=Bradyrhizobium tropiciagri TaxID=312253 RepID=UPI00067D82A9|nr:ABC transporter ATP-binding protein [Bradyrhizobium tropiciagri]